MFFSKQILKDEISSLVNDTSDSNMVLKKKNAIESFTLWLRRKSILEDKDYRQTLKVLHDAEKHVSEKSMNSNNALIHKNDKKSRTKLLLFILLGISISASSLYYIYIKDSKKSVTPTASTVFINNQEGRVLHYKGKLLKADGTPIDIKTDVIFKLYYDAKVGSPIYAGSCIGEEGIIPDHKGYFTLVLGSDCSMKKIPDSLFSKNNDIYLGVTIGDGEELKPRQLISKVGYAMNAEKLKGMVLGSNTSNIPYIDATGKLLINASSPTIQSTSGNFTLEGHTITIQTTPGTNGSIIMSPDLGGNTLIAAGNFGIGNLTPTAKLDVAGDASISGMLNLSAAYSYINALNGGTLTFATSVGGVESLMPRVTLTADGKFGIGTQDPHTLLSTLQTMNNGGVVSFTNNATTDTNSTNVLRLGLGATRESTAAHFIQFFAESNTDKDGVKVGGIRMNNGHVAYETSGADFAEYFSSKQEIPHGYVVGIDRDGVRKAIEGEQVIGVVSDTPGFVGNAKDVNYGSSKVLVGLVGQVSTYVSTINGDIHIGDPIAISTMEGVGKRALPNEQSFGIALEELTDNTSSEKNIINCDSIITNFDQENTTYKCAAIKVLITPQVYKNTITLTDDGEVKGAQRQQLETSSKASPDVMLAITSSTTATFERLKQTFEVVSLKTKDITTRSITGLQARFENVEAGEIISPIITAENIKTESLEVHTISARDNVEVNLQQRTSSEGSSNDFAKLMIKGMRDQVVTEFDAQGNATFSGEINSDTVVTNNVIADTATIAGTLVAKEVKAENIDSIQHSVNNLESSLLNNSSLTDTLRQESQLLVSRLNEIQTELQTLQGSSLPNPQYYPVIQEATIAAIPTVPETSNDISIYKGTVAQSLNVSNVYIEENKVTSLGWNLNLSALSTVDFFDGAVSIAKDGTLTTKGTIVAQGGIKTKEISSLDNTIGVELSEKNEEGNNVIKIVNAQEQEVASINDRGEASFKSLDLSSTSTPSGIIISPSENFNKNGVYTYAVETPAESAGTSYVPENTKELVVYNPAIKENSLVYITNTSPTVTAAANYLAVIEKKSCDGAVTTCKPYFKVVTDKSLEVPTHFNWLIIN